MYKLEAVLYCVRRSRRAHLPRKFSAVSQVEHDITSFATLWARISLWRSGECPASSLGYFMKKLSGSFLKIIISRRRPVLCPRHSREKIGQKRVALVMFLSNRTPAIYLISNAFFIRIFVSSWMLAITLRAARA